MERWKRNVIGLISIAGLTYALYLLWLYRASGGTMTVSYTLPEWEFPLFVGAFMFGVAFVGGWGIMTITDPELAEKRETVLGLFMLGVLLGALSTIWAFYMGGYLGKLPCALLTFAVVAAWALVFRAWGSSAAQEEPITDERLELIELKSWAAAGRNMTIVAAMSLLLANFHLWNPDAETLSFLLVFTWSISMIGARIYYGGRM